MDKGRNFNFNFIYGIQTEDNEENKIHNCGSMQEPDN